jgi:hypothetical protein
MRIIRAYHRMYRDVDGLPPGIAQMNERDRMELRQHGRHIVAALVDGLDATDANRAAHCARARTSAAACGAMAGSAGVPLQQTLALFVRFRGPFLHELGSLCRRRGFDATATACQLERASDALDQLLPAVISGYEGAA